MENLHLRCTKVFQSTPSVWRETRLQATTIYTLSYFNPLPPYGGRQIQNGSFHLFHPFQSTPSVWRETNVDDATISLNPISIHSLRMEGDGAVRIERRCKTCISIHSLRMEGDLIPTVKRIPHSTFQSTPSVWRETSYSLTILFISKHFNPLPPYGGRPRYSLVTGRYSSFQSTPSVWRETEHLKQAASAAGISIHSLRMEGDSTIFLVPILALLFQSTPSVWRETDCSDNWDADQMDFNPLPPYGGRRAFTFNFSIFETFQSTPSVWRETSKIPRSDFPPIYFNPLPPYGGRQLTPDL